MSSPELQEEKKNLIIKRGNCKSSLTRFINFMADPSNFEKLNEIIERVARLEEIYDKFQELQDRIECIEDDSTQIIERTQFEDKYFSVIGMSKDYIKNLSRDSGNKTSILNSDTFVPNSAQSNTHAKINLPTISLATFDGAYENWANFYEMFCALIDKNAQLTTIEKFHYLRSSLKGDSLKVIDALELNDLNYKAALDLLIKRFDNKKQAIRAHIRALFELNAVSRESASCLRNFLDSFQKHYRCLLNLGESVDECDSIMIYLLLSKLDNNTKREWEIKTRDKDSPDIDEFIYFLTDRVRLLEGLELNSNKKVVNSNVVHVSTNINNFFCTFCKGKGHTIGYCEKFKKLKVNERWDKVKELILCVKCLRKGHSVNVCKFKSCFECGKNHHFLLHNVKNVIKSGTSQENNILKNENENSSISPHISNQSSLYSSVSCSGLVNDDIYSLHSSYHSKSQHILLSTAMVKINDSDNNSIMCRALLDSASQSNFISLEMFNLLKLNYKHVKIPIVGINGSLSNINKTIKTKIFSTVNNNWFELSFLVIDQITEALPQNDFDSSPLNIPADINLADPNFNISSKIDILIGGGVFFELLLPNQINLGPEMPILQATKLGFVLGGKLSTFFYPTVQVCNFSKSVNLINLEDQMKSFWEIEHSYVKTNSFSKEELLCEEHFVKTFKRTPDGHFMVTLPLKSNFKLGDSLNMAKNRLYSLERKLIKDSDCKSKYCDFLKEYEDLSHMTRLSSNETLNLSSEFYYIPHHAVIKESSNTTKLRVVFDASAKSANNLSLNENLMVGPCIQQTLFSIFLRFRSHAIVFTADVSKMYRCILVNETQRDLQRIVWRDDNSKNINHFRLNTITYGTSPASFLATRCVKQLSLDFASTHPESSQVIANDFYMDDLLSGSDDIDSAIKIVKDTEKILAGAYLFLRQWSSNDYRILEALSSSDNAKINQYFLKNDKNKTLGTIWDSSTDKLSYIFNDKCKLTFFTKRIILSIISSVFDILGLLGPVTLKGKIIMQKLWLSKIEWDSPIPKDILDYWLLFYNQLPLINSIVIPRHIKIENCVKIELHCFSDASIVGYGAAIYLRSENNLGDVLVRLVCAKSRIAPIKSISLPRLELCGALLGVELTNAVISDFRFNIECIKFWTDSEILLAWLKKEPIDLVTFVSNRIAKIQQLSTVNQWHYVPSKENPADPLSRGLTVSEFLNTKIWFEGPQFLQTLNYDQFNCPIMKEIPDIKKRIIVLNAIVSFKGNIELIERFSSYNKLLKVTVYLLRFKNNCLNKNCRILGDITNEELDSALKILVKLVQQENFSTEIQYLKSSKELLKRSKLIALRPFLDKDGLLRIGGRLENTNLNYDMKHPMILPSKNHLTELIIKHEHLKNLHAGIQLILSIIRQKFWPLKGRLTVSNVLQKCITCFRVKPKTIAPLMSQLPASRVTMFDRAFLACGVDYAGPFEIKEIKFRNRKFLKAYLCIFVCFGSKAVHVELVSDLSTEGFLNMFKRFISRRGLCKDIYSDNGSNFVGADNALKKFIDQVKDDISIKEFLLDNKIKWHFSPPRSPHYGGLWESAVRSFKFHIKRVMKDVKFTYEDFYTVCVQIEAILNSRPLCAMYESSDVGEILTPGHFLIGSALRALPELSIPGEKFTSVSKYRHMKFVIQQFWLKWSRDYLHTLQERKKWRRDSSDEEKFKLDDLVIIMDDSLAPMHWPLGRVIKVYPGQDNIVRCVDIKTQKGEFKRAVHKLAKLPIEL